jgi:hypothetical protein
MTPQEWRKIRTQEARRERLEENFIVFNLFRDLAFPYDIGKLLGFCGVRLVPKRWKRATMRGLFHRSGDIDYGYSGWIDGVPTIYFHGALRNNAKVFVLAHELGHLLLKGSGLRGTTASSDRRRVRVLNSVEELKVNSFSLALLMPRALIRQRLQETDYLSLKGEFAIPNKAGDAYLLWLLDRHAFMIYLYDEYAIVLFRIMDLGPIRAIGRASQAIEENIEVDLQGRIGWHFVDNVGLGRRCAVDEGGKEAFRELLDSIRDAQLSAIASMQVETGKLVWGEWDFPGARLRFDDGGEYVVPERRYHLSIYADVLENPFDPKEGVEFVRVLGVEDQNGELSELWGQGKRPVVPPASEPPEFSREAWIKQALLNLASPRISARTLRGVAKRRRSIGS